MRRTLLAAVLGALAVGAALALVGARPAGALGPPPTSAGYWFVGADGGVFGFGGAGFHGSTGGARLNRPVVGMASTRTGRGYWLVASDGGIFSFGDARFSGSTGNLRLNRPIVAMAATPSGRGYWLVASDGGVFSFGDAVFRGSSGSIRLNSPVVGMAATPSGRGYWQVAADGGIFSFGDAAFAGSTGGQRLASPIVGMAAPPVRLQPEVAAFYYPWYARPDRDGVWRHWEANNHQPPADVAANFYPLRGAYSSSDPSILAAHMADMAGSGIDLVVSSWWGRDSYEDQVLPSVLLAASARGLRVAAHLEPYVGRTIASIESDIAHLRSRGIRDVWVYEAQAYPAPAWAALRDRIGNDVRLMASSASLTAVKAGLFAPFAKAARLDGVYTYDPVRYAPSEFAGVCAGARQANVLCSPSPAPGYVATRTKPRDAQFVSREGGNRYDGQWTGAIEAGADVVSVTSYNEWHEGTQIEPAVPYCFPDGVCSPGYDGAYGVSGAAAANAYLDRTRFWSAAYRGR